MNTHESKSDLVYTHETLTIFFYIYIKPLLFSRANCACNSHAVGTVYGLPDAD